MSSLPSFLLPLLPRSLSPSPLPPSFTLSLLRNINSPQKGRGGRGGIGRKGKEQISINAFLLLFWSSAVSVKVTVVVIQHWLKATWGGEDLLDLHILNHSPLREAKSGTKPGGNAETGADVDSMEEAAYRLVPT